MEQLALLHVDRAAQPTFSALNPAIRLGGEVGENFFLATGFSSDLSGLARFALPVALTFPIVKVENDLSLAMVESELKHLALKHGAVGASITSIRRHGRFVAARLLEWSKRVFSDESGFEMDAPYLHVLVSEATIYAGVASARTVGSPFPGGKFLSDLSAENCVATMPSAASRAGGKLTEALAFLEAWTGAETAGRRWLELGAFPGGMTQVLLRDAAAVTSVDLRGVPDALGPAPRLSWIQANVEDFAARATSASTPDLLLNCDGLVCDLNGPALPSARTVARLLPLLAFGSPVVHTIKLRTWGETRATVDAVLEILSTAGLTHSALRHFGRNRKEITVTGRCGSRAQTKLLSV